MPTENPITRKHLPGLELVRSQVSITNPLAAEQLEYLISQASAAHSAPEVQHDDSAKICASLPPGHGHCQLDVLWESGRSAAGAVISQDQYAQILSILMPNVADFAAGFHAAVAEPDQQAEQQPLGIDSEGGSHD